VRSGVGTSSRGDPRHHLHPNTGTLVSDVTDLSLITVTYRSASTMGAFLAAARRAAPTAQVVVVDNASDDDTIEVVRQHDPAATVVACAENLGFGRGSNLGASHASGEWLLFLNPDLALRKVALPTRASVHDTGLWSGVIGSDDERFDRSGLRAETSLAEDYVAQLFSHLLPPSLSSRIPIRRRPSGWASGALFLTRRDAFRQVGGFDPRYFLYYEDRDLGAKYRCSGRPLRALDTLVGTHAHSGSSSNVSLAQRNAWSFVSWFEYIAKWRGQATAIRAAHRTFATFEKFLRLEHAAPAIPRVRQKAYRVAEVLRHMEHFQDDLPQTSEVYYPYARHAIQAAISRAASK
jgi:N-acetylglucosaminyl-diphospho-decaprenol L-rhamnosyltransferase